MTSFYEQVYAVVRCIPSGKVTSYGRIAKMLGKPRAARAVGYALNALKDKQDTPTYANIPWHRVVNHAGRISAVNRELSANKQAIRLQAEGVHVNDALQIDLSQHLWAGLSILEIDDILHSFP